ncbi:MAG: ribosome biogenesis GTP-binding protein YihA/YsxC [Rhodospirillaceae bacterium]
MSILKEATFIASAHELSELPRDRGREIAFAGRSNAGKSTAINALTRRKLAFVSKTPGRTQTINFFRLTDEARIVDLPGYGYAAVAQRERQHWGRLISTYLQSRESLCGLVLIMDARHPLTPLDMQLVNWYRESGQPLHALLTKSDKLGKQEAQAVLRNVESALAHAYPAATVQLFSGVTGIGVPAAQKTLLGWLK